MLASHHKRVESGEEARKLNGIGEKIAKKIDEFLQTGKLEKLEKVSYSFECRFRVDECFFRFQIRKDDRNAIIQSLTRVSGIGPAKARELVDSGIKSIEDLRHHPDKLNHHQRIGLK